MPQTVWQTELSGLGTPKRGKVRDIYDLGDRLLLVACDRISAYDHVLRPGIPGKGKILHQISNFWFEQLADVVPGHLDHGPWPAAVEAHREILQGRTAWAKKAEVIPFECVVRGYLAGSGFRDYNQSGEICGVPLTAGLRRADQLPEPIFTPATKAETGHDENISYAVMAGAIGEELASRLRDISLELYRRGSVHARQRGLILADTKFEFGLVDGELTLIDEVLTPDSSRYWEMETWVPGSEPPSFDKQYVRNWLDSTGWDRESTPPLLPEEVVAGTLERYCEAFRRLSGREPRL